MLLIFEAVIIGLLIFDYRLNFYRLSPFSAISVPYAVLIPLNNLVAVKYGFYSISDNVIIMELSALICFFIGTVISRVMCENTLKKGVKSSKLGYRKIANYKVDKIYRYCSIVIGIEVLRIIYIVLAHGIGYFFMPKNEGLILKGPLGHLLLTIYPLLPILFFTWLNDKKQKRYLMLCLLGALVLFSSLVKYHVIGLMVLMFLFVCMECKQYLYKGIIIIIACACAFFILNYSITFMYRKINVGSTFYFAHLWKYLAGSLIYNDIIFTKGLRVGLSEFYKLGRIFFALPNMFIKKIFGNMLFSEIEDTQFMLVSSIGESGNVVDFIGYLFPSKGDIFSMIGFEVLMIVFGFIVNFAYIRSINNINEFVLPISVVITFFCFLSFFAVYGGLIPPWEILVWSLIMPKLFYKHRKYKLKIGNLNI